MSNLYLADEELTCIIYETIKRVTLHPVKLTLRWQSDVDLKEVAEEICKDITGKFDKPVDTNFQKYIKELTWETVVLPAGYYTFYSKDTGSKDVRGGGCGNQDFDEDDFVFEIDSPTGLTLKQVTEAVYRLKGSKYDYWYELFSWLKREIM